MFTTDARSALIRAINASGLTKRDISRTLGREQSYVGTIIAKGNVPSTSNYASILDVCGFDLIMRRRDDGTETLIEP